jgi:heme exporter protein A
MSDVSHNTKSIETIKITKSYGRNVAVKDLSINVVWGETLSVIGPNGLGKSTLIKIISGITRPDSGISNIAGMDISKSNNNIRRLIGVVTHDTLLYEGLTGFENLQFAVRIFGLDRIEERINNVTRKMHLRKLLHAKVGALSHGLQKRFSIARSLLHEPDSGLDQESLNILDSIILVHSIPF